ncbi:hypothetical protein HYC85_027205 [Camellia sinensis]|uniref:Probable magnesium transporter n=1 Tax=Camellia sinensis TaxID=4442 RepID=A0A7J7G9T8_CAMSI|nr:hypothetical protein HYC85_027205 [Camellia sinensis]
MWESICLTIAATAGNNIGKVLQKKGTVIRAYAFNKAWIIGFLMDMFGAALMLQALSQAPVSVIQPVSGCGLAILSVFSHFYLKERMNIIDWVGIALAGIGTIGVGAGGEEQQASSISIAHLPWLAFVVAFLYYLTDGFASTDVTEENKRWVASVISKMGFVFLEQGFSKLLTRGLKHGRAIVVSTCAAVASIVTGVLAGMLALGERLPSAPMARLSVLFFIILGVVLLVTSTRLVRYLPRPLRRIVQSSVDRNLGLRRHGSLHARDPTSPSAIIQATTLHHLMSSPSKEKA